MIRWLDHTADVQLEVTARHLGDIYTEFVRGMRELLVSGPVREAEARELTLNAAASGDLLIALGRQILMLFYGEGFVPSHLRNYSAGETRLEGTLWGEPFDPERHKCPLEVKGITYYALSFEKKGEDWYAVVTFDV